MITAAEVKSLVDQFDEEDVRCLVINLAAVAIMSSLALSRIIRAHVKFTKRSARVHLCNLDTRIEAVFVIAKLSMVFPVYRDEAAALAACAGQAK